MGAGWGVPPATLAQRLDAYARERAAYEDVPDCGYCDDQIDPRVHEYLSVSEHEAYHLRCAPAAELRAAS